MKVLTNALLLNDKFSGVEYYTENLLKAFAKIGDNKLIIKALISNSYSGDLEGAANIEFEKLSFNTHHRLRRIYYEQFKLCKYFFGNSFNLYHSTGYILPFFTKIPSVLTVHDLIALDYPEYCKSETALYYGLYLPQSLYNAKRIIAISHKVKDDILRRFNIDADKIDVVYHGTGKEFKKVMSADILEEVVRRYHLPDKFLLFVGNLEPKKNLLRLIDAFVDLKTHAGIKHKLVIVGKDGWKYEGIYRKIRSSALHKEIIFTGYISKNDLPAIYSLADLFVFPSLYEGFGLPVLEAMACGTPVLISDRGALPEIAGSAFPVVNPFNVNDISAKIYAFLTDPNLRLKSTIYGMDRAKQFTWEKTARETLEVYHRALNNSKATAAKVL